MLVRPHVQAVAKVTQSRSTGTTLGEREAATTPSDRFIQSTHDFLSHSPWGRQKLNGISGQHTHTHTYTHSHTRKLCSLTTGVKADTPLGITTEGHTIAWGSGHAVQSFFVSSSPSSPPDAPIFHCFKSLVAPDTTRTPPTAHRRALGKGSSRNSAAISSRVIRAMASNDSVRPRSANSKAICDCCTMLWVAGSA